MFSNAMIKKTVLFSVIALWGCGWGRTQTVDCLVAIVNGQVLTLEDLQVAKEFGIFAREIQDKSGDSRLAVLDALIDQKAVLEIAKEPMPVTKSNLDKALEALRAANGAEAFRAKLHRFGLSENDLRPYLEERLRFEKIVAARLGGMIAIGRNDVEKYYQDVYVQERRSKGLEPEPLAQILPQVESNVRDKIRADKQAEWVKSVRSQATIRINKDCLK
jgi:hypothetical protein